MNMELIYKNESYVIVGACMNVYNEKGCGFLEPVYHYLSATGCRLGLLVNFGQYPGIEYERLLPRKQEPVDVCL